jgi:hypothetical protein
MNDNFNQIHDEYSILRILEIESSLSPNEIEKLLNYHACNDRIHLDASYYNSDEINRNDANFNIKSLPRIFDLSSSIHKKIEIWLKDLKIKIGNNTDIYTKEIFQFEVSNIDSIYVRCLVSKFQIKKHKLINTNFPTTMDNLVLESYIATFQISKSMFSH